MPFYGEEYYSPLVDTPALFLKFSRLADKGGVSTGEWIAWIEKYGVLGALPERKHVTAKRDYTQDAYSLFVEEAQRASRTRRLFEATTKSRKADLETIAKLLPSDLKGFLVKAVARDRGNATIGDEAST